MTQENPYAGETFEPGISKVFADLWLPNSEEYLAKSQFVQRISKNIKEQKLIQVKAGEVLSIDQTRVSKLFRGRFSEFSTSTLLEYLTHLDKDIEIVARQKIAKKKQPLYL